MIGHTNKLNKDWYKKNKTTIIIPLHWWFNDNYKLPIVALQYYNVRFCIEFNKLSELVQIKSTNKHRCVPNVCLDNVYLLIDYLLMKEILQYENNHYYIIQMLLN